MALNRTLAVGLVLLGGAFADAQDPAAPTISVPQARRELKETLNKMYRGEFNHSWRRVEKIKTHPLRDVNVGTGGFSFEATRDVGNKWSFGTTLKSERVEFRFRDLEPISISQDRPHQPKQAFFAGPDKEEPCTRKCGVFYWLDRRDAEAFARAVNRLIQQAKQGKEDMGFATFQSQAAAWRKLPTKAPLSAAADRHRVLAESAVRENQMEAAAMHYDEALESSPLWPEGWMNAALIYAELKDYESAAERMRHYLELMPDAPDAKAAREQMIVWEAKAK